MKLNITLAKAGLAILTAAIIAGCTSKPMDVSNREDQTIASIPQQQAGFDTFGRQWGQTAPTESQVIAPAPAPMPEAPPAPAPVPSTCSSEINTPLIHATKQVPAQVALGETYESDINVTALACCGNVVLLDRIPTGASFVKSDPAAEVNGNILVWKLQDIDGGQSVPVKVWLRADQQGSLVNCAMISAEPRMCATTIVGKPELAIQKTGPETAVLGSQVTYNIVVSNPGNAVAKNVVVTDATPDGMTGQPLNQPVGDLGPGESKTLSVTYTASARGKACDDAVASSDNAGRVDSQACTLVQQPGLKIVKTGDDKQVIGRKANYQITVSNVGDTALQNVSVVDTAPDGTMIAAADGASVNGNTSSWSIDSLAAGDSKTFTVTLIGKVAGQFCNSASASSGGLSDTAQACTVWRGVAGILLEMVDDPDPVQVGDTVTYTIKITNQGFADLHNIGMTAQFKDEIDPVSTPDGTVNGKTVNFPVVPVLQAKNVITYTITAKGVRAGDHITTATLTADELTQPVLKEESTTVY